MIMPEYLAGLSQLGSGYRGSERRAPSASPTGFRVCRAGGIQEGKSGDVQAHEHSTRRRILTAFRPYTNGTFWQISAPLAIRGAI